MFSVNLSSSRLDALIFPFCSEMLNLLLSKHAVKHGVGEGKEKKKNYTATVGAESDC